MKQSKQQLIKLIIHSFASASKENQKAAIDLVGERSLQDVSRETLKLLYNMLDHPKVR